MIDWGNEGKPRPHSGRLARKQVNGTYLIVAFTTDVMNAAEPARRTNLGV